MASISWDKGGRGRVKFYDAKGTQKGVRLGKLPKRDAEQIRGNVERILVAKASGQPVDPATAAWIGSLGPQLRKRMERAGLVEPLESEQRPRMTLIAFVNAYIDSRSDVKPNTWKNYDQAKKYLERYFGGSKMLDAVTPAEADEYRRWLTTDRKLAQNTVKRLCGRAKQFFRHALRKRLVSENPFADMRNLRVTGNPDRLYFVPAVDIEKVIATCPDADWRSIVALCRWGGLRPSEACSLRWADIEWDRNAFRVRCGKTEHIAGRDWRRVPIFPELRPHLEASLAAKAERAEFVITRYRNDQNLRTQFERIIQRAGVKPWKKVFQNLRATRETELARNWPMHTVCSWLGNTPSVAVNHYLQVTSEDYRQAASIRTCVEEPDKSGSGGQPGRAAPAVSQPPKSGPKSGPAHVGIQRTDAHGQRGRAVQQSLPFQDSSGSGVVHHHAPHSPQNPVPPRGNEHCGFLPQELGDSEGAGPKSGPTGLPDHESTLDGTPAHLVELAERITALPPEALASLQATIGELVSGMDRRRLVSNTNCPE